jgi:hypothetical protein
MEALTERMPLNVVIPENQDVAAVVPAAARINGVMAFSVRSDGQSAYPTDSLNFIKGQDNSGEDVTRNLERLGSRLAIDARRVVTCRQIHADDIAVLNALPDSTPSADAIITEKPGIFPAIKTADCLPILILEPRKRVAAAIHAGWRGTVLRIARKVLLTMKTRFGCDPSHMIVGLGPAIGACCYEVDETVLTPFRRAIPQADRFISVRPSVQPMKDTSAPSHRLDLTAINRYELEAEGVPEENIFELGLCTSCNPGLFFSYRRDGALSGRHISLTGFRQ